MIRDLHVYKTGSYDDHAHKGADLAREILGELGLTDGTETDMIKIYGMPTCPYCDFVHEQIKGRERETRNNPLESFCTITIYKTEMWRLL